MRPAASQFSLRVLSRSQLTVSALLARLDNLTKRSLDIGAALLGLLLLAPVLLFLGMILNRTSPGPVLYRGRRTGQNGREFQMLKFRTMKECPESYKGPKVTAEDDPRILPFGRWLRDTKLNELPQLWNVLKGDMSLVGPRPEDPEIVATWPEEVRREVLSVRPGITSPASVLYRHEESLLRHGKVMETYLRSILPSKLRLDQLYVRHRSLWLDLDVLFWTVIVLLPMWNSISPAEELLFLGPVSKVVRRYFSWFVVDMSITLCAIAAAGLVWRFFEPLNVGWLPAVGTALGFALLFSLTGALLGINRIAWSRAYASEASGLVVSTGCAGFFALLVNQVWGANPLLPPGLIGLASALALLGFITARYRTRLVSGFANRWLERTGSARAARERVLIIGSGYSGQFMAWLLENGYSSSAFRVVGYVDDNLYKQGIRFQGADVLGRRGDISRLVAQHDIGIIVFAIHNIAAVERARVLEICASTPARVVVAPDILGTLNALVSKSDDGAPCDEMEYKAAGAPAAIPAAEMRTWLAELERNAHKGNLADLYTQIQFMRERLDFRDAA